MFRRLLIVVFCLACLSAAASQYLMNPKFHHRFDGMIEMPEDAEYVLSKRAFSFQAARGKKSLTGEKRYSYFPSRG